MPPCEERQETPPPSGERGTAEHDAPASQPGVSFFPQDPNLPCNSLCCVMPNLFRRYHMMDHFPVGQTITGFERYCWTPVHAGVWVAAKAVRDFGLAPWSDLQPAVRDKMARWSPVAQQLWESDFHQHQEAILRAWIWHYLDDNLISFSGEVPPGELLPCTSPVWNHVRELRRELDVLRSGRPELGQYTQDRHRMQYHFWRQLTDSLVREGLGLADFTTPANAVSHFKTSLRLLVTDGDAKIPDFPSDREWYRIDKPGDLAEEFSLVFKNLIQSAITFQEFQHSMMQSCMLRFTPIGSDELWGFPVDDEWMYHFAPFEIPRTRPGEPLPLVQLVCAPMLVISGMEGLDYERDTQLWLDGRMEVVAPWTFGGEEAEKHTTPGYEKGWQARLLKEDQEKDEAAKQTKIANAKGRNVAADDDGGGDEQQREEEEEEAEGEDQKDGDYIEASPTKGKRRRSKTGNRRAKGRKGARGKTAAKEKRAAKRR